MVFFYKSYPYAPSMTFCSAFTMLGILLSGAFGIVLAIQLEAVKLIIGALLIALALYLYFIVYRKKIPAKAAEISKKNIETKPGFALQFCRENPQAYDEIAAVNSAFAEKYELGENGKIVKRK